MLRIDGQQFTIFVRKLSNQNLDTVMNINPGMTCKFLDYVPDTFQSLNLKVPNTSILKTVLGKQSCRNIEALNVSGLNFFDIEENVKCLEVVMPTVKFLIMNYCSATEISKVFGNCHHLKELQFKSCEFVNDDLVDVITTNATFLEAINLARTHITDKSIRFLRRLKSLRYLDVSGCINITDDGFDKIRDLGALKLFVARCVRVESQTANNIIRDCTNLAVLDVSCTDSSRTIFDVRQRKDSRLNVYYQGYPNLLARFAGCVHELNFNVLGRWFRCLECKKLHQKDLDGMSGYWPFWNGHWPFKLMK